MRGVKTKNNKWKQVGIFLILLLLFLVALNSVHGVYKKKKSAEEVLARMEAEAVVLKARGAFLTDSLAKLETKEGLKFEIRKKLNVAEVGESVAIIVEEPKTTSTKPAFLSEWQQLKNFFKNLFD